MKLSKMLISHFKGVETLTIVPAGKHVVVRGKNGLGKTSVAEALAWVLTGDAKSPLRNGAEEVKVQTDFGGIVVTRSKKADGKTSISVKRTDGKPMDGGAAAFLKQIVGPGIGLAPMHLFQLRDEDQVDAILRAMGVDIKADDAEAKRVYDERSDLNRDLKQKNAERAALVAHGADTAVDGRVNGAALVTQRRVIQARVDANAAAQRRVEDAQAKKASAEQALLAAQSAHAAATRQLADAVAIPHDEGASAELAAADQAIAGMSARNAAAERHELYVRLTRAVAELEADTAKRTKHLDAMRDARAKKVAGAAARIGIADLAIADDGSALTYKGVRLTELSTSEKLVFAARFVAGTKPELQIMVADGAESMDEEHLAEVFDLAHDLDIQLILTQVTQAPVMEIEIRDGQEEETGMNSIRDFIERIDDAVMSAMDFWPVRAAIFCIGVLAFIMFILCMTYLMGSAWHAGSGN